MNRFLKILLWIFLTLLITCISLFFYFSPMLNNLPKPIGNYAVGITSMSFIDESRKEIYNTDPNHHREIVVDFYYPTSDMHHRKNLYKPEFFNALIQDFAYQTPLPSFIWKKLLTNIYWHGITNAPISQDNQSYPVIIFSHGIGSIALYGSYLQELASRGYIVASVYHPYDTQVVTFPDGRTIHLNPLFGAMIKAMARDKIYAYRSNAHKIWLEDLKFIVDKLEHLQTDPSSMFYQKLDLAHLGALGHSHGGATIIDLAKLDNRVKAGIDMDGWTKTANSLEGFNKPFMFLVNENGNDDIHDLFKNMGKDSYYAKIKGAGHGAFSDYILLKWPLTKFFDVTSGNSQEVRAPIIWTIISFFDHYFKNDKTAIDDLIFEFPSIIMEKK